MILDENTDIHKLGKWLEDNGLTDRLPSEETPQQWFDRNMEDIFCRPLIYEYMKKNGIELGFKEYNGEPLYMNSHFMPIHEGIVKINTTLHIDTYRHPLPMTLEYVKFINLHRYNQLLPVGMYCGYNQLLPVGMYCETLEVDDYFHIPDLERIGSLRIKLRTIPIEICE